MPLRGHRPRVASGCAVMADARAGLGSGRGGSSRTRNVTDGSVLDQRRVDRHSPAMNFAVDEGVLETAEGRRIGWMRRGPEDGRVVGWFHGQPGSRRDLCAFTEETLCRFGIRLLGIDRAGYGET